MISPIFSLSDEDRDNADSLVIKPPQVVVRVSHRDKRSHKRTGKDRFKETSRKDKKLLYNRCVLYIFESTVTLSRHIMFC